jgi:hypothetical protein
MAEYAPITREANWFIGEKKTFQYTIRNADGSAANIATWDLEWRLRPAAESETVYILKTSATGGINKSDPNAGVCIVTIDPDDYDVVSGAGTFDNALKRTDGDNDQTLAFGEAVLQASA